MKTTEIPEPLKAGAERDCTIRSGYRIFANATHGGGPHCWSSPNLEMAQLLAKTICEETAQEVEITKYLGCIRRKAPETEWLEAREAKSV